MNNNIKFKLVICTLLIFFLTCCIVSNRKKDTSPLIQEVFPQKHENTFASDDNLEDYKDEAYYMTKGKIYLDKCDYENAMKIFQQGIVKYPSNAKFYEYIGHISIFQGNFKAAQNAYTYSIKLNKNQQNILTPLLECLTQKNFEKSTILAYNIVTNKESEEKKDNLLKKDKIINKKEILRPKEKEPSSSEDFIPPKGLWNDSQKWNAQKYGWITIETKNYQMQSEGDEDMSKYLVNHLEKLNRIYRDYFSSILPDNIYTGKYVVKLFSQRKGFLVYGASPSAKAYYNRGDKELVTYISDEEQMALLKRRDYKNETSPLDEIIGSINHEGWHQYFHTLVGNKAKDITWIDEGLAEYFEKLKIDKETDELEVGELKKEAYIIKRHIVMNRYIPFSKFFYYNQKDYYEIPDISYPQGWSVVYFLMLHKNSPKYQNLYYPRYEINQNYTNVLERILKKFVETKDLNETYKYGFYGLDINQIEADWKDFWTKWVSNNR